MAPGDVMGGLAVLPRPGGTLPKDLDLGMAPGSITFGGRQTFVRGVESAARMDFGQVKGNAAVGSRPRRDFQP